MSARNPKQKFFVVYYDPKDDIVYFGAVSRSMDLYQGRIGYSEFAGRRIGQTTLHIDENGDLRVHNGSYERYGADGFIDREYAQEKLLWLMSRSPSQSGEQADRMTARRIQEGRLNLSWSETPSVMSRVVDYIMDGKIGPGVRFSRQLTRLTADVEGVDP